MKIKNEVNKTTIRIKEQFKYRLDHFSYVINSKGELVIKNTKDSIVVIAVRGRYVLDALIISLALQNRINY